MMTMFAVSIILQNVFVLAFSADTRSIPARYAALPLTLGPVTVPLMYVIGFAISVVADPRGALASLTHRFRPRPARERRRPLGRDDARRRRPPRADADLRAGRGLRGRRRRAHRRGVPVRAVERRLLSAQQPRHRRARRPRQRARHARRRHRRSAPCKASADWRSATATATSSAWRSSWPFSPSGRAASSEGRALDPLTQSCRHTPKSRSSSSPSSRSGSRRSFVGDYWQQLGFRTLIYLTLAEGWNLMAGSAGLVSLGVSCFVGLGAYVAFGLLNGFGLPLPLALCAQRAGGRGARLPGLPRAVPAAGTLFHRRHARPRRTAAPDHGQRLRFRRRDAESS